MSYTSAVSDPGSGGAAWNVDDLAGVLTPVSKIAWGVEGTVTPVTAAAPLPVGDGGGSLTIDGTVAVSGTVAISAASLPLPSGAATAAKQPALGTAGTASTDVLTVQGIASMTALKVDGSAVTQPVSAASLPLPSGAATSAKQDTIIGHVDGIEALLTTLAGAVSGSEMQVDVLTLPALPAGDNNIGNVDVVTVPTDPFGANGDAASATGSISAKLRFIAVTGIPITGTVAISAAALPLPSGAATSAKQDSQITLLAGGLPAALGAQGALKVEGVASGTAIPVSVATIPSHAVTNAGTFATQESGAALTALQLIDDAVYADEGSFTPATSKHIAVGFLADETAPDSAAEGTIGVARMTLDRKLWTAVELESNSMRTGGVAATPKFAIIDAATSGNNTLVSAVNPKKIRVLSAFLVAAGTVNARFESGADGTALTGQMNLVANTGFVLPFNPYGWFETASNTLLNLELSGAISVDGAIQYVEVP